LTLAFLRSKRTDDDDEESGSESDSARLLRDEEGGLVQHGSGAQANADLALPNQGAGNADLLQEQAKYRSQFRGESRLFLDRPIPLVFVFSF